MRSGIYLGALLGATALAGTASAQAVAPPSADSVRVDQTGDAVPGDTARVGKEAGHFMVRLRMIDVMPLVSSSSISPIGGKAAVSNAAMPELDLSYFFTDHIAAELIASSTQHTVSAHNTAIGSTTVGQTWVLPPTLTLQYHFNPHGAFSPYVGAGLNVTFFYDGTPSHAPINRLALDTGVGPALQAGIDWNFSGHWFANVDVKQIFVDTTAHINGGAIKAKVSLDPTVVGMGIGYRF